MEAKPANLFCFHFTLNEFFNPPHLPGWLPNMFICCHKLGKKDRVNCAYCKQFAILPLYLVVNTWHWKYIKISIKNRILE